MKNTIFAICLADWLLQWSLTGLTSCTPSVCNPSHCRSRIRYDLMINFWPDPDTILCCWDFELVYPVTGLMEFLQAPQSESLKACTLSYIWPWINIDWPQVEVWFEASQWASLWFCINWQSLCPKKHFLYLQVKLSPPNSCIK